MRLVERGKYVEQLGETFEGNTVEAEWRYLVGIGLYLGDGGEAGSLCGMVFSD